MKKNVFSIFLLAAFSVSLFLLVSCATTFPAHEIHPDFECADSDREPIVISGTLKSGMFFSKSSCNQMLFVELFFNRSEKSYFWEGEIGPDGEKIPVSFWLYINVASKESDGDWIYMDSFTCENMKFTLYDKLDTKLTAPMNQICYFYLEGKRYFVYVTTSDGMDWINIGGNPSNVAFDIEAEGSDRKAHVFTDIDILDSYRLEGKKDENPKTDRTLKILSGVIASYYRAGLQALEKTLTFHPKKE